MEAYLSGRNMFVSALTGAGKSSTFELQLYLESSELRFRFCLRNLGTKCLSKVNLHHWIYISFPAIYSRFKQALVNFHLKCFFRITLYRVNKFALSIDAGKTHTCSIILVNWGRTGSFCHSIQGIPNVI